jgi:EAL domain-containing protein (putative c-di-GMP-specific phosphodiesterase class I)
VGVHVTVDDFGAGCSSLGGLKTLPIDQIKLDRHLLGDRGGDGRDRAILGGLLALTAALDVDVVAEGVEQMEQLDLVRDLGCRRAQGYLFARPMPAAELPGWLDAWAENDAGRRLAAGPLSRAPLRLAGTASSAL